MRVKKLLPNPFVLANGAPITSREQWAQWREETREMVLELEYGTLPGVPADTRVKVLETREEEGKTVFQKLHFQFFAEKDRADASFGLDVTIRFPTPAITSRVKEHIRQFGDEGLPCVIYIGDNPCEVLYKQGFVVINYKNDQLEPLEMGNPIVGPAQAAYEKVTPGEYTWGSIAVWAWGGMRMVDYALSLPEINKKQLIITGHSRNGKTALLAGALDDRIAIVNPAGSGCAGCGSYLVLDEGCEDIASLTDTRRWWAWMHPDFAYYGYNEEGMFFDQHFLMGLVAPRVLLRTEGILDEWANPQGTAAAFLATEEIFNFLGVPENNQLALRPGGHTQNHEDLLALLSVANAAFFDVPQERIFKDMVCEPSKFPRFMDWKSPL